ncbi:methyl-accepting chemotaxis protein [Vibrio sp. ZSDE26]|uniref:Methyl-accepting chemotaxis protein n=1 Tax=Vibrio amylolyticus TaxID=2847292 RepID=A0A9X2BIR0_9VIBR|nr:methyl-accepting chemotaxis protein [Vibrio amylolyticus]MCK6264979.1 methyl-accepting chemotaxis protein [Vibrio amylolyticus]
MARQTLVTRFMLSLSIRAQLILITLFLLSGILTYGLYEQYSFNQLNLLQTADHENQSSEIDLLTLRRHEKDFLARQDPKYVKRFDQTMGQLKQRIEHIQQLLPDQKALIQDPVSISLDTLTLYQQQFRQLAEQLLLQGTVSGEGLTLDVIETRINLSEKVNALQDVSLQSAYTLLLNRSLQFKGNPNRDSLNLFITEIETFVLLSQRYPTIETAVNAYRQSVLALLDSHQLIGLTAQSGLQGNLRTNVHRTEEAIHTLQDQVTELNAVAITQVTLKLQIIGASIALIVSSMLLFIGKSITSRIGKITNLMKDISEGNGDLTVRMNAKGQDELAQLANSFDTFVAKLHTNISEIASVMHTLSDCATTSEQAAKQSMMNAEQQKQESESVATAVNELVMTSNEITANIESAADNALRVKNEAEKSMQITNVAGESIQVLATNIGDSQQLVHELSVHSHEIKHVISTITSIAEQTNLLALNAAIEAARAGENGRGFAVVADEVRQLSQKTNESTQQIEDTINGLTSGVESTVKTMQESLEQVNISNNHTVEAVHSIQKIVDQITEVFDMNALIATASEEQSMVSAEIDRNITQIADLAGSTAVQVAKTGTSSQEVINVSQKLKGVVAQFKY